MLKKIGFVVIALGVALGSTSIANAGNPLGACKACHFFDKGAEVKKNNLGPGLKGIFGRVVSIDGTPFTVWDEASLDTWLANPKKVKASTKMTYKQKKEKKRAAIIEALKGI